MKTSTKYYCGNLHTAYYKVADLLTDTNTTIAAKYEFAQTGEMTHKLTNGLYIWRFVDADSNFVYILL